MIDKQTKIETAKRMRALSDEERDAAIEASDDVLDLRPALHERIKQRELAKVYRKPWGPPGGGRA